MVKTVPDGGGSPASGTADRWDVVVVGAGLAGLAAAHQLTAAGLRVTVLEAEDQPGGRSATDTVDGFRLDRTPQLFSPNWPELARIPALAGLRLRPFAPGALLQVDGRAHRVGEVRQPVGGDAVGRPGGAGRLPGRRVGARRDRRGRGALHTARALTGGRGRAAVTGALDLVRLRNALGRFAALPPERLLARAELPAAQALSARGLPPRTVDSLLGPLLSALLSDPELSTSSRVADLVLRCFLRGGLCLPEGGSGSLSERLADALPEGTVRVGVRAESVTTSTVRTAEHGSFRCRAVLVATGARGAAELLPGLRVPDFHPATLLHHAVDADLVQGASGRGRAAAAGKGNGGVLAACSPAARPWHRAPLAGTQLPSLLIDGDRSGPVSHSWAASAVDPARAPRGRTLVSSVVLGRATTDAAGVLDKAARSQLAALHGMSADSWTLLAAHHDPRAVPAMPAPHDLQRPVRVLGGLYVCGDHRDTSSAHGALVSARRAVREVLRDFQLPLPAEEVPLPVAA